VRSVRRLWGECGQTRTWPGMRGLRLTKAKEYGVVKKTWRCQIRHSRFG
jgi:phage major head subunit gpT-like protein